MTSPLENLAGTGKPLAAEPMDAAEFAGLLRSGAARLVDARNASHRIARPGKPLRPNETFALIEVRPSPADAVNLERP